MTDTGGDKGPIPDSRGEGARSSSVRRAATASSDFARDIVAVEIADVAKIGAAAIPFVGGSIVKTIEVFQKVREKRVERLRDETIVRLGDRIDQLEARLDEAALRNLIEDAIERAAQMRDEINIDLVADVLATAVMFHSTPEDFAQDHEVLRSLSSLTSAHFRILRSVASPQSGRFVLERELAMRNPELSQLLEPILAELTADRLIIERREGQIVEDLSGTHVEPKEEAWGIGSYGRWLLDRIDGAQTSHD